MKRCSLALLLALAGCAASSEGAPDAGPRDAGADASSGLGTDDGTIAKCLGCHGDVADRWSRPSSHRALLDCNGCHGLGTAFPHAQSPKLPVCGACHSESAHPGGADACLGCHDPHGSPNVFLIRPTLTLPDGGAAAIHFTKVEGASADGLARAGIAGQKAGTGLCEVCHSSTAHYDSDGGGSPHEVAWCGQCHDHQASFAPSPPP